MTLSRVTLISGLTALCWPIFTVLPDTRFGPILGINSLVYAMLAVAIVLTVKLKMTKSRWVALGLLVLVFPMSSVPIAIHLGLPEFEFKLLDILLTYLIFAGAGIIAGLNPERFFSTFFIMLFGISLANLAVELVPDFAIEDRSRVGALGGQGYARLLSLSTVGIIVFPKHPLFRKFLVRALLLSGAFSLCFLVGSRGAALSILAASIVLMWQRNSGLWILTAVGSMLFCLTFYELFFSYYLSVLRPWAASGAASPGIARMVLTFDLLNISTLGSGQVLSALERFDLWKEGWRLAVEYPFGVGLSGYGVLAVGVDAVFPHNIFVEALAEFGLFFGAMFVFLVLAIWLRATRQLFVVTLVPIVFFQFSGDLVDARQLVFFLSAVLADSSKVES